MRKLMSMLLAAAMVASMGTIAFAADWQSGTEVTYSASTSENWTVTVPARLTAGGDADEVILEGNWNTERKVVVTADATVTLTYNEETEVVEVNFDGIEQVGNNIADIYVSEAISVDAPQNALFGTWTGIFNYQANIVDVEGGNNAEVLSFTFDCYDEYSGEYNYEQGMTWAAWVESDYAEVNSSVVFRNDADTVYVDLYEDGSYTAGGILVKNGEIVNPNDLIESATYRFDGAE